MSAFISLTIGYLTSVTIRFQLNATHLMRAQTKNAVTAAVNAKLYGHKLGPRWPHRHRQLEPDSRQLSRPPGLASAHKHAYLIGHN